MKKIFALIAALVATISMNAQSLCFCDSEGNVYEDGATLTMNEAEEDDFGDLLVPLKNVYIKNVSEDDIDGITLRVSIDAFAGDGFQCCFGTNCRRVSKAGNLDVTNVAVEAGSQVELKNTEWVVIPEQYESLATKFMLIDDSNTLATLNVNFVYADPAGIEEVDSNLSPLTTNLYNIAGQRVSSTAKGLVIKNGHKFIVK